MRLLAQQQQQQQQQITMAISAMDIEDKGKFDALFSTTMTLQTTTCRVAQPRR